MSEWQVIELVPKDGTQFLVCWGADDYSIMRWNGAELVYANNGVTPVRLPWCWMPLPLPPKSEQQP